MTDTDICNMALSHIGKGTIANRQEGLEDARACDLFYEPARREILREFPWGFAHRLERLALADVTIPGWEYVYGWPDKCLKLNKLVDEVAYPCEREPFDIVNVNAGTKLIVTNLEQAYADYVWDVEDLNLWDDVALQAFSHLLASKITVRLTGNPQMSQQEYQLYKLGIQSAQLQDAREEQHEPVFYSNYAKARQGRMW